MIPKDVLKESVVKPYSQGVLDEDINLGETSNICGRTNRAVWGATAI